MIKTQLGSNQRTYTEEAGFSGYIKKCHLLPVCDTSIMQIIQDIPKIIKQYKFRVY